MQMNAKPPRRQEMKIESSWRLGVLAFSFLFAAHAFAESPATFTISENEFIGPPLVGFGAQMNPYLYCTPNSGEVNEANVKDLERKVIDLAPQHVRIFALSKWWTGEADDVIAKRDRSIKESFVRTIRLAQRAGATVNLTLWYGPFPHPEESAQKFVDLLAHLVRDEKLTAIQYVTLQNEVNGEPEGKPMKVTFETYRALYREFDARLREAGLRDQIKIIGGDLVYLNQERWFKFMGDDLADVLDGYSIHIYWDYWDSAKLQRRISEVPPIVDALPAKGRKPLYLTEFGVRGKRDDPTVEPGVFTDGKHITQTPLQAMQIAWLMMEAINRGYVTTVQWDMYDAWYDRLMHYGMIGDVKSGWELRPAYQVLKTFTHHCKPGWRAVRVEGTDENILVAAVRGKAREMTVFVLNRGEKPADVVITGLPHAMRVSLKPLELKALSPLREE
jgi:hypothetical protein